MIPFEEFLPRYSKLIWSQLHKWNINSQDQDDVFQDISMKLFTRYAALWSEERENIEAWITASIKLQVKSSVHSYFGYSHKGDGNKSLAQQLIDASEDIDGVEVFASYPSAETDFLASLDDTDAWALVDGLSDRQRECITLRYYNDLTPAEIVFKTDYTAKQVERALAEGLRNLRVLQGVCYSGKRGASKGTNHFKKDE